MCCPIRDDDKRRLSSPPRNNSGMFYRPLFYSFLYLKYLLVPQLPASESQLVITLWTTLTRWNLWYFCFLVKRNTPETLIKGILTENRVATGNLSLTKSKQTVLVSKVFTCNHYSNLLIVVNFFVTINRFSCLQYYHRK